MQRIKLIIIFVLIAVLAVPVFAERRKKEIKNAGALLSSAKIAMRGNPPRLEEAMGYLNEVLENEGPLPEAYFYKGSIYGEYVSREYDLARKNDLIDSMMTSYDSVYISCDDKETDKKLKKNCKEYHDILDSVKSALWIENFNSAITVLGHLDKEYLPTYRNATDSVIEAEAKKIVDAAVDSSLLYFKAAMMVDPSEYRAFEGTGIVYDRLKMLDSSAAWFIKAHNIVPDSLNIIQNIAYAFIMQNDWDNAILWFRKLLEKVPDDVGTMTNVAICFNNKQLYDSAFAYNMMVVKADSTDADAFIDIGQYYLLKSQRISDSVKEYQTNGDQKSAEKFIVERDRLFDSCATYFKKGVELNPENITGLENYGIISMITGDYNASEMVFTKLTELEPNRKEHWIDLGDTYVQLQKFDEAIAPFEKASELDPSDVRLWEILADLYESSGQTQKAKAAKSKAEELKNM
nr:tetratricopeptide repeat protein [candidate division Zixibacteria bacterium]